MRFDRVGLLGDNNTVCISHANLTFYLATRGLTNRNEIPSIIRTRSEWLKSEGKNEVWGYRILSILFLKKKLVGFSRSITIPKVHDFILTAHDVYSGA
jgi:hypothetical protein